jgi:16S rRNA C967 or C1407 C5-methylase (RsmB/RsmF family)
LSILRKTDGTKTAAPATVDYLAVTLSHPRWLIEYLLDEGYTPKQVEVFCEYNNSHEGVVLRANTLKASRDEVIAMLAAEGIEAIPGNYAPEAIRLKGAGGIGKSRVITGGFAVMQDEASQLAAHVLNPGSGVRHKGVEPHTVLSQKQRRLLAQKPLPVAPLRKVPFSPTSKLAPKSSILSDSCVHTCDFAGQRPGRSARRFWLKTASHPSRMDWCAEQGSATTQGRIPLLEALTKLQRIKAPAEAYGFDSLMPKVLDICAAPGGKTTHIAQLMENRGELHAFDVHEHKTLLIEENCRRLGIDIVQVAAADARTLPESYQAWADYVLLDVPCSGLGVLNRRADARWNKNHDKIIYMVEASRELLLAAADYTKEGGILCFATCTITREENIDTLRWFLAERKDFKLVPLGIGEMLPEDDEYRKTAKEGYVQFFPGRGGLGGFFIAKMRKNNS